MNDANDVINSLLSLLFLIGTILAWPLPYVPFLCDIVAISIITYHLLMGRLIKDDWLFFLVLLVVILSTISFEVENILFAVRWGIYIITVYLIYLHTDKQRLYRTLLNLQLLTLPVGILYNKYLETVDPYNLHLLGDMMFSGSKNHYSFFIVVNYIFLSSCVKQLRRNDLLITIISIIQIAMSMSATGFATFVVSLILLNVSNLKRIFKAGFIIAVLGILLFGIGANVTVVNQYFNERVIRAFHRVMMFQYDESFNIRTDILFKLFNQEISTRSLFKNLFGSGRFDSFSTQWAYDNSYYAIFIGGGFLLTTIMIIIILKNIFSTRDVHYAVLLVASMLFFITANVFFELQNALSTVLLIVPNAAFAQRQLIDQGTQNVKTRMSANSSCKAT